MWLFKLLKSNSSLVSALWCYQCVSNEPGCGKEFNWWWHWSKVCPENDDICVKILERKDSKYDSLIIEPSVNCFF